MQAIHPGLAKPRAVGVVYLLLMFRTSGVAGSVTQAMVMVTCLNFYSYALSVDVINHKFNTRGSEAVSSTP